MTDRWPDVTLLQGDCLSHLQKMNSESVHCCVTSPPYWGLRDYNVDGQIGLEPTLQEYIEALRTVFAEIMRVLRPDATLWLNLGDCYKEKQLQGVPWRVAFALQCDGWYLRSDIVWAKPNPMPESCTDRPTRAHEFVFLMSRSQQYWYDPGAIRTPVKTEPSSWKMPDGFGGSRS